MEQSGGGAEEMNSPLFPTPSLVEGPRVQQLCVEMRNKPNVVA